MKKLIFAILLFLPFEAKGARFSADTVTVTDAGTGLMWQREDNDVVYYWDSALAYCEGRELGGYTNWRLPNIKELTSIVSYTSTNPAIDLTYFPGTNSSSYWSSSADFSGDYINYAWYVNFNDGQVNRAPMGQNYVRCVRSYD